MQVLGFVQVEDSEGIPSRADQLGAIHDYCARKGLELAGVYQSTLREEVAEGLALARSGGADAVIAAVQGALWPDAAHSQEILQDSVDRFGVIITSVGLDSTTRGGKRLLDRLLQRMDTVLLPSTAPLPPPDLVRRVTGTPDVPAFESTGDLDLRDFEAALTRQGRAFNETMRVLDFGCGCGRLLRHLRTRGAGAELSGCDIDDVAIEWVGANLEGVTARRNGWLPPLPFDDAQFDLVVGFSVFTHLDAEYQDRWLAELRRVTRDGGLLMLTTHGERVENGFSFWSGDGWAEFFPDYYHTMFHTAPYIERHWGRELSVLEIVEAGAGLSHDLVVLGR